MTEYILGLDLGPNSIGWALVAARKEGSDLTPTGLLDTRSAGHAPLGVRIFEAGLQNFDTAKEASLNQSRRQARAARRVLSRRRARKAQTQRILLEAGLLPSDESTIAELWRLNPYRLRTEALERPLSDHELGRALFHLAQRRGFKSNRLSGDEKEEKGLLLEISKLQAQIDGSGARTLGEFLNQQQLDKNGKLPPRLRARHSRMDLYEDAPRRTQRSMYEHEFDAILDAQSNLRGAPPLTSDQREALHKALFFQHDFRVSDERRTAAPSRANLHRAPDVRPCPLEKGERCCPKSDWLAQRFRIIKEVRNLRISEEHQAERLLTQEESEAIIAAVSISKETKFSALEKLLTKQFGLRAPIEFNLARGGRGSLKGNEIESKLATAFGKKAWAALAEPQREEARHALQNETSPDALDARLAQLGFSDESKREKLVEFRPRDAGYLGFSRKALERIVPMMESGHDEHYAIEAAYPDNFEADGLAQLPSLVAIQLDEKVRAGVSPQIGADLAGLTNPVVRRALVELRKVVNAIVREHGKPARITVELARELRQGPEARKEASKRNRDREKHREEGRKFLKDLLREWPRRSDLERWSLWKEQREQCPYCGKPISCQSMISADTEVDHILPRWQSLDDSRANKVLACANCNAAKGNRTPIGWRGSDSDETRAMLKRVHSMAESSSHPHGMASGKTKRFQREHVDPNEFAASQLNDTRYISRLAAKYLLLLYPTALHAGQKVVRTATGGLTARLRREWGLTRIIPPLVKAHGEILEDFIEHDGWTEKVRIDHRHHAVDALVVALTTRGFVKRLQDSWRAREVEHKLNASFPAPWENLRSDAEQAVNAINVSHRPMRRRRGALHEETFYGRVRHKPDTYVTRKRLEELTGPMVSKIRDHGVRKLVEARLREKGWNGKDSNLPKGWCEEELWTQVGPARPERRARRPHPIRRVRIEVTIKKSVQLGDRGHRFAKPGGNYCLEVAEVDGAPGTLFRVSSTFEAHQRDRQAALPGGLLELSRFYRKDSVLLDVEGIQEPVLAVVQVISGGELFTPSDLFVVFRDARDARPASQGNKMPLARIQSSGAWTAVCPRRVEIDSLGRILVG